MSIGGFLITAALAWLAMSLIDRAYERVERDRRIRRRLWQGK